VDEDYYGCSYWSNCVLWDSLRSGEVDELEFVPAGTYGDIPLQRCVLRRQDHRSSCRTLRRRLLSDQARSAPLLKVLGLDRPWHLQSEIVRCSCSYFFSPTLLGTQRYCPSQQRNGDSHRWRRRWKQPIYLCPVACAHDAHGREKYCQALETR